MVRQKLLDLRLEKEGIDPGRVATLTAVRLDMKTDKITDKGIEAGGGMSSVIFGYLIAFILYMMIALYGQNMLRGVLEEKTTRVAEVIVSSVKPDVLLAGKILGVGLGGAHPGVRVGGRRGGDVRVPRADLRQVRRARRRPP